jgi:murein DD-endopeptidase MepM/ murein hydrolase activator NlpD
VALGLAAREVNLFQSDDKQTIWSRLGAFRRRSQASLCAAFPERQILIRTDGRVRFFVFGSLHQITMTGFGLLLVAWVACTSINVIVQNWVITTEHSRLRQVQMLYEARNAAIDDFEAQQNALAAIIERNEKVVSALRFGAGHPGANSTRAAAASSEESTGSITDSGEPITAKEPLGRGGYANPVPSPSPARRTEPQARGAVGPAGRSSAAPQPGTVQPRHESFLHNVVSRFAEFLRQESGAAAVVDDPILLQLEPQQIWLAELKEKQLALLRKLGQNLETDTKRFHLALQNIGFAPEMFIVRAHAAEEPSGRGGPLLSLPAALTDNGDSEYLAQLANAADSLDTLTRMNAVPWMRPIDADTGTASGFGVRRDPFTKELAFHSGLDLSGPWGSPVRATAPGIVIYAGRRGAYGNTVEIDHGYGIRTRYGHLRSTLVQTGAKVERGAPVGLLGSTGRSTGPHVHYEVWYGNSARDPQKFIKAGQFLLQE